jgi:hypothetical protein
MSFVEDVFQVNLIKWRRNSILSVFFLLDYVNFMDGDKGGGEGRCEGVAERGGSETKRSRPAPGSTTTIIFRYVRIQAVCFLLLKNWPRTGGPMRAEGAVRLLFGSTGLAVCGRQLSGLLSMLIAAES